MWAKIKKYIYYKLEFNPYAAGDKFNQYRSLKKLRLKIYIY